MHRFTEPTPTSAGRVEVVVADWEIECCAPPPVVGGLTSWLLEFATHGDDPLLDHEVLWAVSRWDERTTRLDRGGVAAYWASGNGDPPASGETRLRGRLQGTVHGGTSPLGFPPCRGRVDRVRLLRQRYREIAPRTWAGIPGTVTATDVAESPRWFDQPGEPAGPRAFGVLLEIAPGLPSAVIG